MLDYILKVKINDNIVGLFHLNLNSVYYGWGFEGEFDLELSLTAYELELAWFLTDFRYQLAFVVVMVVLFTVLYAVIDDLLRHLYSDY